VQEPERRERQARDGGANRQHQQRPPCDQVAVDQRRDRRVSDEPEQDASAGGGAQHGRDRAEPVGMVAQRQDECDRDGAEQRPGGKRARIAGEPALRSGCARYV
jgi:hypothetical protein